MLHSIVGPCRRLIRMARNAWIGNLVLFRHRWRDETESVSVNESIGHAFGFDCRHVAGHALTARAAVFVVCVFFNGWGARAVGR